MAGYGFSPGNLQGTLAQAYALDPRVAYAKQLMQDAGSGAPVYSPLGGLARVLQGVAGGYVTKQIQDEYQQRQRGYSDTMARALLAGQGGVKGWTNPDTGQQDVAEQKPGPQAMASILMGNPDTAPVGLEFQKTALQKQLEGEMKREDRRNEWALRLENEPALSAANEEAKFPAWQRREQTQRDLDFQYKPRIAAETARAETPVLVDRQNRMIPGKAREAAAVSQATLPDRMAVAQAGRSQTNVSVNTGNKSLYEGLGTQVSKNLVESADTARAAANQVAALQPAKDMLKAGIFSGTGADWRLGAARFLKTAHIYNDERVENTDAFISQMGRQTLGLVKQLGSSNSITNADRDFAERVAGGRITMDGDAINRLVNLNEHAARAVVEQHNARIKPVLDDPNVPEAFKASLRVDLSDASAPAAGAANPAAAPRIRTYNPATGRLE